MINGKKGKFLALLLVFGIGVSLSFISFFLTYRSEKEKIQDLFNDTAEYKIKYIKDALGDALDALGAFGDFYASSHKVERAEFELFSNGFFTRQPYLYEFRWLRRVKDDQRQAFEEASRSEGLAGFEIKELDQDGRFIPAQRREEYYPIYYISAARQRGVEYEAQILGLDAASFPERWQAMQTARDSSFPATTRETKQVGEEGISAVARVFLPIYRNGLPHNTLQERRDNLVGFAVLLYRLDQLIKGALTGIPHEGVDISVYETGAGKKQLLYFHPSEISKTRIGTALAEAGAQRSGGIAWSETFKFANQELTFFCFSYPEFFSSHKIIWPWVILIIGLALTLLLAFYFKSIIDRAEQVEALVRQRTEQLRVAGEFNEKILKTIPFPMDIVDEQGNILFLNEKFQAIVGGDCLRKKCWEVYRDDKTQCLNCPLRKGVSLSETSTIESTGVLGGRSFLIIHSGMIYQGKEAILEMFQDITELKEAEARIRKANEELGRKNEELKKLDQLKSDFVSVVSHELRTPLSIMKEGISLVLDKITGEINEKTRTTLSTVFTNINRLNKLITDLLDISKIEAGRMLPRKALTDINGFIKEAAEKWRIETERKKQSLEVVTAEGWMNIYLDPDKIIQVLNNLLSNAVKFTPEGGRIKVEVFDRGDQVEVSVSDNGPGIDKENLPKVFEKFQQFQRPVGAGAKGTGLGLAICKELINLHEGLIRVESEAGKGAKFSFTLPKKDSETVFREHIAGGIRAVSVNSSPLSLISIRVMEFSRLQKELGIDKLHQLLKEIEDITRGSLRGKADTVVRDTGELVIILFDTAKPAAQAVKQRLEEVIRNYLIGSREEQVKSLALNIGFAVYPEEAKDGGELLNKARGVIHA